MEFSKAPGGLVGLFVATTSSVQGSLLALQAGISPSRFLGLYVTPGMEPRSADTRQTSTPLYYCSALGPGFMEGGPNLVNGVGQFGQYSLTGGNSRLFQLLGMSGTQVDPTRACNDLLHPPRPVHR